MRIARKSQLTGKVRIQTLDVTPEEMTAWCHGTYAQDAFPRLDADEREFIMTGITADEWEAAYADA